jgi:Tol biopolymer transport system component
MRSRIKAVILAASVAAACGETDGPTSGTLKLSTAITGLDFPATFGLSLDDGPAFTIASSGELVISGVATGSHTLTLVGAPANCGIEGGSAVTVTVSAGAEAALTVAITCVATTGVLEITAVTMGTDHPAMYQVELDDTLPAGAMEATGVRVIDKVSPGTHTVGLVVSDNCSASNNEGDASGPNTHSVAVTAGGITRDTARTNFAISCVTNAGMIEVATATSGHDLDRNGYRVQVVGQATQPVVGLNTVTRFGGLAQGDYTVELDEVASNCAVTDGNTRTLHVTTGGAMRDTVRTAFQVSCERAYQVAFARARHDTVHVVVAAADFTNPLVLANGLFPSWSPDGARLAYEHQDCEEDPLDGWDWWCRVSLFLINTDSVGSARLTDLSGDTRVAWSPDGSKILFADDGHLFLINPDGSGRAAIPLPDSVAGAREPAWSPDGQEIAFTCSVTAGWVDLCAVRPDGSGFHRLTADPWQDGSPAWSLDGARVAFVTNRDVATGEGRVAVMDVDGSGFEGLVAGGWPTWDGARIVFTVTGDAQTRGLYAINPDGTGLVRLTGEVDSGPAWRP